ncbi:MAG TPA: Crp/Fnr family transcriptional regulator [Candidatus Saccharimonadales bacterium]|nr:Crp/Fnr family transcriptional regulator [Candidatus Saccharimonadales bacterium]
MESLRSFYRLYPVRKVGKGQIILHQNDIPQKIYAIKSGVIKITNLTSSGEEKLISFKITDDILPICWAFSITNRSLFYYQTYTDCEFYLVDKEDFSQQAANDMSFAQGLLRRQVSAFVGNQLQVDALSKSRAIFKLLYIFRFLCLSYGKPLQEGFTKIQVPLTQQEIANLTGLTRETAALELNKIKNKKVIAWSQRYYIVNTKKLNAIIDDEYNPGIVNDRLG